MDMNSWGGIKLYTINFTTLAPTRKITKWIAVPGTASYEEIKTIIFKKFHHVLEVNEIREISEAIVLS